MSNRRTDIVGVTFEPVADPSPVRPPVPKYPSVVNKKSRQQRRLGPHSSSGHKRHSHDFLENVQDRQAYARENQASNPPSR